jgi:N-acetylglucosamine-6-sulfatase
MSVLPRRWSLALAVAVLGVVAASQSLVAPAAPAAAAGRPNIILITADDMNASDMAWMPRTRELLGDGGVEVTDFISNHPLCCPARAEILTGQMGHNNGVHSNSGPYGGYDDLIDKGNHVGSWLKASGYRTAFVGKHLNNWPEYGKPQGGWTVFDPFYKRGYKPYGVVTYNDGRPKRYPNTYTADLVGDLTARYINRFSDSGAPFFIWASQLPPHKMTDDAGRWVYPIPAKRHRDLYPGALPPAMSSPSYKEADVSDKPGYVSRRTGPSDHKMKQAHRARIRSLKAVDDQVARIVRVLRKRGELGNTYLFFTSDNGYLLGEHRLVSKNVPYEEALQVPLLVRGPGLAPGGQRDELYGMVDLAPTFADIANTSPKRRVDGRSMLATLSGGAPGYVRYLIQATNGGKPWWWRGVRSRTHTYVEYSGGQRELYDLVADPFQLESRHGDPAYEALRQGYAEQLAALKSCSGAECYGPVAD